MQELLKSLQDLPVPSSNPEPGRSHVKGEGADFLLAEAADTLKAMQVCVQVFTLLPPLSPPTFGASMSASARLALAWCQSCLGQAWRPYTSILCITEDAATFVCSLSNPDSAYLPGMPCKCALELPGWFCRGSSCRLPEADRCACPSWSQVCDYCYPSYPLKCSVSKPHLSTHFAIVSDRHMVSIVMTLG